MMGEEVNLVQCSKAACSNGTLLTVLGSSKVLYMMTPGRLTASFSAIKASLVAPKTKSSRCALAMAKKVSLDLVSSASKNPTTTTLSALMKSSKLSAVTALTEGSVYFAMKETMPLEVRGPGYGEASPSRNTSD